MFRKLMTRPKVTALILLLVFTTPLHLTAEATVDKSDHSLLPANADEYANQGIDSEGIIALSATELEKLIGPVALYPDNLLAIVLPASTYPVEIVLASRFLDAYEADNSIEPNKAWDESVIALMNYPEVLRMMDKEIDWAARLGNAVINQQADLIAAIETFRDRAYAAGNLETDEYQSVENSGGVIEITPVDEKVIYVPYYEPEKVIIYQTQPIYAYYPVPRPVYYYPYPAGYSFSNNRFWGVTTVFTIGWPNRYLNVHHRSYRGHPYYGHSYYSHYYRRPSISVYNTWYVHNSYHASNHRHRDGDQWRSRNRHNRSRNNTTHIQNEFYSQNTRLNGHSENRGRDRLNTRRGQRSTTNEPSISRNSTNTTRTSVNGTVNQPRVNASNRNPVATTDRLADQERSRQRQTRGRDRLNTRRDQRSTTNEPSISRNSTNTTRTNVNGTVNQPRVNANNRNQLATNDHLADQERSRQRQTRSRDRLNTRQDLRSTTSEPSVSTNMNRTAVNDTVNQPRVNANNRNQLETTDRLADQRGSRQRQTSRRNTSADNSAIHFRDRPETNTVTSSQRSDVRRSAQVGSSR